VTERVWQTEQNNYVRLLPRAIGVSPRGRSKRLERVLTDFGSEHSFRQAVARVLEHYGFEINASAVRDATLQHAHRAEQMLQKEYEQPFRVLPAAGAAQVVAEADGSMVCTVAPGPRKAKSRGIGRKYVWRQHKPWAARKHSTPPPLPRWTKWGGVGGHCARGRGWASIAKSTHSVMVPNGSVCRPPRSLARKARSCATIIM